MRKFIICNGQKRMIFHRIIVEGDLTTFDFMGVPVLLINYAEEWVTAEPDIED